MILKRLLVTALGALGLGALATGPAFADDDQIPGPRLYGDISSCAGGILPSASTAKGAASLLGKGGVLDRAFDSDTTTDGIQMDFTQDAALIVTATTDNESDMLVALLNVANCENPVANNISEAADLYNAYVGAKRTFEALEEPTADDSAAYNTARMNKENFGGDVYNSVYDQRAKLAAANKAIADYNKLVGGTGTLAQLKDNVDTTSGTAQTGGYDDIAVVVANRVTDWNPTPTDANNVTLTGGALNSNLNSQVAPVYGSGNTAGYRAIAGNDSADDTSVVDTTTVDAPGGTRAAFNAAGALQFQVGNQGTNAFSRASTDIDTLGEIVHELSRWQTAVDTAQTKLDAAKEAGNLDTRAQEESLRRATLGRDHVQGELDHLTRVVRSQNLAIDTANQVTIVGPETGPNDDVTYTSERDLLDAYLKSRGNVVSAAAKVRSAISSLDGANRAVQARLKNPDNYLNQLVTLREYQEADAKSELADAGGDDALQSFKDAVKNAGTALKAARDQRMAHQNLTSEPGNTTSQLLNALLEPDTVNGKQNPADDDGQALLNAISSVDSEVSTLKGQLTDADGNPIDLANLGNAEEIAALTTDVSTNTTDIEGLDGRVTANEVDIAQINSDLYGTTSGQHADVCPPGDGLIGKTDCALQRSAHNADDIADLNGEVEVLEGRVDDHEMKLMQKKEYIDNLAAEIGVDPVTGMGTEDNGMSRIDNNESRSMDNHTAIGMNSDMIATNAGNIADNAGNIMTNADNIAAETANRMEADMMLAGGIDANKMRLDTHEMLVTQNTSAISALDGRVGSNESAIQRNSGMIGELSESLEVVRAGVAASMALAGMPAVNGRGIAIGVGSFDGESAFAVGFQIQGEQASFKVGVTSSGGATGASAGVGFNF